MKALRLDLHAPVASFKDPQFPGVIRSLPLPSPATLRGMLSAVVGNLDYSPEIAYCSHANGFGEDIETYHPISKDTFKTLSEGRAHFGSGGATISTRPFLVDVSVSVWVALEDAEYVGRFAKSPVWGLRLGRSQDIVDNLRATQVELEPVESHSLGSSVIETGLQGNSSISSFRLARRTKRNRQSQFSSYSWSYQDNNKTEIISEQGKQIYADPDKGLVWFL